MDAEIIMKINNEAKKFAFEAIADPNNHMDAVEEFESGFIHGAEWLFENYNDIIESTLKSRTVYR